MKKDFSLASRFADKPVTMGVLSPDSNWPSYSVYSFFFRCISRAIVYYYLCDKCASETVLPPRAWLSGGTWTPKPHHRSLLEFVHQTSEFTCSCSCWCWRWPKVRETKCRPPTRSRAPSFRRMRCGCGAGPTPRCDAWTSDGPRPRPRRAWCGSASKRDSRVGPTCRGTNGSIEGWIEWDGDRGRATTTILFSI